MPPSSSQTRTTTEHDVLTNAILRVLTPVMICMILAIWFVHGHGDRTKCTARERQLSPEFYSQIFSSSTQSSNNNALIAGIFIGGFAFLMVSFTFLIVWLYKTRRQKIIKGWLTISVFFIFGYLGGLYVFDFCRSHCINLDWITLVLAIWNFTVTGLFAVFRPVPRIINQAYLIIMSALMAFIFRPLPSWSIWAILAVLVIWDLYAVLAPKGPLKTLVALAREREDDLPALIYDTNPRDAGREYSKAASSRPKPLKTSDLPLVDTEAEAPTNAPQQNDELASNELAGTQVSRPGHRRRYFQRKTRDPNATENLSQNTPENEEEDAAISTNLPTATPAIETKEEIPVGTLGTHLKLGLGDFVFYSILVAEASKTSVMTAVTSFIAILAGLCVTLFLVTVCRKALPALPISISAGLLFYLLTRYSLQPFVANLLGELLFH